MASPAFKQSIPADRLVADSAAAPFVGAPVGSSRVGDMQRELQRRLSNNPTKKWSSRRTLVFVCGVCGLFWAAIAAMVLAVL